MEWKYTQMEISILDHLKVIRSMAVGSFTGLAYLLPSALHKNTWNITMEPGGEGYLMVKEFIKNQLETSTRDNSKMV